MSPDEIAAQVGAPSLGGEPPFAHDCSVPACDGHALVAHELRALGVTHVYCVPGGPVYATVGACAAQGIVEVFGGYGEQVTDVEGIGPALRRALACGKPACINVPLDPDAPFPCR